MNTYYDLELIDTSKTPSYQDRVSYPTIAWYQESIYSIMEQIANFIDVNTIGKGMHAIPFVCTDTEFRFNLYCLVRTVRRYILEFERYQSEFLGLRTHIDCDITPVRHVTDSDFRGNTKAYLDMISEYSDEVALQMQYLQYTNSLGQTSK